MRLAVRFAYDGTRFAGSQRQPGERTAESELLTALQGIGAITSADHNHFRVASRTDRGVSALGNVFTVDTDFRKEELLAALNASCDDVFCHAIAVVPRDFSVRRARGRWYRYHLPLRGHDIGLMALGAKEFEGMHDFRLFCKPDGRVTKRTLDSVTVSQSAGMIVIDLRAREFLRNMVRRIASSLDQLGQGKVSLEDVRQALSGHGRSMGLAEPEGLFLMDVDLGLDWEHHPTGRMGSIAADRLHRARVRLEYYKALQTAITLIADPPGS